MSIDRNTDVVEREFGDEYIDDMQQARDLCQIPDSKSLDGIADICVCMPRRVRSAGRARASLKDVWSDQHSEPGCPSIGTSFSVIDLSNLRPFVELET